MKRCWTVRVAGFRPFSMIVMDGDSDPRAIVRAKWPTAEIE